MLQFNLERIFRTRGIDKPFAFLRKLGFAESHSSRMKNGGIKAMNIKTMEKICIGLHCTPNDLMEWIPEKTQPISADHPLNQLVRSKKSIEIWNKLQSVPLDKLEAIEKYIENETKTKN